MACGACREDQRTPVHVPGLARRDSTEVRLSTLHRPDNKAATRSAKAVLRMRMPSVVAQSSTGSAGSDDAYCMAAAATSPALASRSKRGGLYAFHAPALR